MTSEIEMDSVWSETWRVRLRNMVARMAAFFCGTVVAGSERAARERCFFNAIERYAGVIDRICRSFATSGDDFSDLRQDTLVNIWNGLDGFRADSGLKTWIYRVTLNTCVSTYRKRPKGVFFDTEEKGDAATGPESVRFEDRQLLDYLLSGLSVEEHAIMTMWLDDLSYEEIADVMGLNRNTVGTRISRIRKRMKDAADECRKYR